MIDPVKNESRGKGRNQDQQQCRYVHATPPWWSDEISTGKSRALGRTKKSALSDKNPTRIGLAYLAAKI